MSLPLVILLALPQLPTPLSPALVARVPFALCLATPAAPQQIIWAMLFHLFRFSVFMLVVMASFALAFHSLFSHPNCTAGDDLYERYRTLHDSLLHMFEAMIGGKARLVYFNLSRPRPWLFIDVWYSQPSLQTFRLVAASRQPVGSPT